MSKWEKVKLGDICAGKVASLKTNSDCEIEYIDIASIDNLKKQVVSSRKINAKDAPSRAKQLLKEKDVLVSTVRPNLNAVAMIKTNSDKVLVGSTGYCVLRCTDKILAEFLFLYCQSKGFVRNLTKVAKGASYPAVSDSDVKSLQIPLPPLEVQQKIAQTLDAAAELISLRKQQLAELDNLIKALFYEMFGDPVTNEKGWSTCGIGTVAMLQGGFAFKSADYIDKGVKLAKISNVHCRKLNWDDISYLPECYLEVYQNFSLKNDDVLMAMTRPIIKSLSSVKVIRVSEMDLPCLLNQRVGRFKIIIPEAINNSYLYWFCLSTHFKNEVERYSNINSLQPNISSEQIESINIPLPPLSLQNQFVAIVTKIEEQKALVQKAIDESQYLFDSLMNEYFN